MTKVCVFIYVEMYTIHRWGCISFVFVCIYQNERGSCFSHLCLGDRWVIWWILLKENYGREFDIFSKTGFRKQAWK